MKAYAENKKARFNYEILDEYEAGVILSGPEVKSIRAGQISLKESYATLSRGAIWLTNAHISPYKPAQNKDYDPTASRKLLLNKAEIEKIGSKLAGEGTALIPLRVYDKNGKIKVAIGLGKGKKKYDKREVLRKRDIARDSARDIKGLGK